MGGDPKGGRVCWPSPGATTMFWEEIVGVGDLSGSGTTKSSAYINPPSIYASGYLISTTSAVSGFFHLHEDYAGGQIQYRAYGWLNNAGSSDTHTVRLFSRFHANGSNLQVAYVNQADATFPASGTGFNYLITPLTNFTPDGTWAAGKGLWVKLTRTDTNSDGPYIEAIKLRYEINL